MKKYIIYLLVFSMFWIINPLSGQFYGGGHDGFSEETTGMSNVNEQLFYCSGGDADGYHGSGTGLITLNEQLSYCQGGLNDGNSSSQTGLMVMNEQLFYCLGGNEDGFSSGETGLSTVNLQTFYCLGGDNDGISSSLFTGYYYNPVEYYSGGIEDGWSSSLYEGPFYPLEYCLGGQGDGWYSLSTGVSSVNTQDFYCNAGDGDGYDAAYFFGSIQSIFLYCLGGQGDGHRADTSGMQLLGYGIWTGASSNLWPMATNWKYNTLPTDSSSVLIPAGAPYYPLLNDTLSINFAHGSYQCKRLDILSGGQLTARDQLTVNGILNVGGILNFKKISNNNFTILSEGKLTINSGGEVKVE